MSKRKVTVVLDSDVEALVASCKDSSESKGRRFTDDDAVNFLIRIGFKIAVHHFAHEFAEILKSVTPDVPEQK